MALQFPQNRDVIDVRSPNTFSRLWLGFLEAVYKRVSAAEAVTAISTADVGVAGGTYSQSYADEQTALINELKAKVNELQATFRG